jgi:molybdenum cofactor cytidylyltransferase
MKRLTSIILAAGSSSRLGQEKQLVKLNGTTLLRRMAELASTLTPKTLCVLGFNSNAMLAEIQDINVDSIINENWSQGMGTSIAHGIKYQNTKVDAVLILLCDQWKINKEDLSRLVLAWNNMGDGVNDDSTHNRIIASYYFNQNNKIFGAPCIFPKKYFPELSQLTKTGARYLLEKYKKQVTAVELSNAAFDLDTQQDLKQLRE